MRTVLIEGTATGGQAGQSSRIENYLGFPDGLSGSQLADRARRQAEKFGAELITARTAVGLDVNGARRTIRFADGGSIDGRAVIPSHRGRVPDTARGGLRATDRRGRVLRRTIDYHRLRRRAGVHSRGRELGRSGRGEPVPVRVSSVTIVVWGPSLEASMSHYLIQQVEAIDNITVRTHNGPRGLR